MRNGRREAVPDRHFPHELLQETRESFVIKPDKRNRFNAVLKRLWIKREAHFEVFQTFPAPGEVKILTLHFPGIEVLFALYLQKETTGVAFLLLAPVPLDDRLRNCLLCSQHVVIQEVSVLSAFLFRQFAPEIYGFRRLKS